MYDYIIFTHISVFYKVNLYNEISKNFKIHVVFIANETDEKRSQDFIDKRAIRFDYTVVSQESLQSRKILQNLQAINKIIRAMTYKRIIVGGWDLIEFWYLVFFNTKKKNCLTLESTILESVTSGIRAYLKKLFLSRIDRVFASGNLHKQLLMALNYKGEVKITKGVGIINKPSIDMVTRAPYSKNYLYVGRLSEEKNLISLVHIFNDFSKHRLKVIGTGPLEGKLKQVANENINFLGQVANKKLKNFYQKNDFLILASLQEPWGLVVEEALYFGMPVIISDKCGASELIENSVNGFVFDSEKQLREIIERQNETSYSELLDGVGNFSIELKDKWQVEAYG